MPSVSVEIQPAVLDWALRKAQTESNADSAVGLLAEWVSGEKKPTFSQLQKISKQISVPFGYFFLKEPPVERCGIVDFRTVDSIAVQEPSRNLIDTVDIMTRAQEWMSEYVKEIGVSSNLFVGSLDSRVSIGLAANTIRRDLGISLFWYKEFRNATDAFKSLRNLVADMGILVMMNGVVGNNTHRLLSVEEFRAFTLVDPYAPLIFINTRDSENGKLFSLLHEIVHVWIGKNSLYNDLHGIAPRVSAEEQFCNAVAAELLVPVAAFIDEWDKKDGSGDTETIIHEIGSSFVCSRHVLLRRARDTEKISQTEYLRVLHIYQEEYRNADEIRKEKNNKGGDFYRSLSAKWDKRFIRALNVSTQSGRTQYRDAYRLTNTTGKTFHELVGKVASS